MHDRHMPRRITLLFTFRLQTQFDLKIACGVGHFYRQRNCEAELYNKSDEKQNKIKTNDILVMSFELTVLFLVSGSHSTQCSSDCIQYVESNTL